MKQLLKTLLQKIQHIQYLPRHIVLVADTGLSVLATLISYVLVIETAQGIIQPDAVKTILISSALISALLLYTIGLHRKIIRHFTLSSVNKIFIMASLKEALLIAIAYSTECVDSALVPLCALVDFLATSFFLISIRAILIQIYADLINNADTKTENIFVFSTQNKSPHIGELINKTTNYPYKVVGYLSSKKHRQGLTISESTVHYINADKQKITALLRKYNIKGILFTSPKDFARAKKSNLLEICVAENVQPLISGELHAADTTTAPLPKIKPVQIEDLLDRDEITLDLDAIKHQLEGKTILITGAAGSIGSEIVNQLAQFPIKKLILLDNAETPLHSLQLKIRETYPTLNLHVCLGDVRSTSRVADTLKNHQPNLIFHAAAYKHVPMVEYNPREGVLVNVWGTYNLAHQAILHGVEKFIMISTDKAVNPTNVMGASKRIAEMCVQSLNTVGKTQFVTTRFGNVLGSNGSVIPRFKEQIAAGGPVTVTHPHIIRYFMTIPEACRLVLQAASMGNGGEIFVFDMGEQVKIDDLARKMILLSGRIPDKDIKVEYTGLRPGEKLHEELLSNKETTLETHHPKIRKAKASDLSTDDITRDIRKLIISARKFQSDDTIILMKKLVPEFISQNSNHEKFDNP